MENSESSDFSRAAYSHQFALAPFQRIVKYSGEKFHDAFHKSITAFNFVSLYSVIKQLISNKLQIPKMRNKERKREKEREITIPSCYICLEKYHIKFISSIINLCSSQIIKFQVTYSFRISLIITLQYLLKKKKEI